MAPPRGAATALSPESFFGRLERTCENTLDAFNRLRRPDGACGVAAAAGAAHVPGAEHLNSVALILLVHAAALLGLTARARDSAGWGARLWLASALAVAFGAALFSADVALLALRGARLFPMAAPTGGTLMILGWLAGFFAGISRSSKELPLINGRRLSLRPRNRSGARMKVAIVHEWLVMRAGSERVVEEILALFPRRRPVHADLRAAARAGRRCCAGAR